MIKKDYSLKCQWVAAIKESKRLLVLSECFLPPLKQKIWLCNISPKDVRKIMKPSFWRDVLIAWANVQWHTPDNVTKIAAQVLWYNSHIKTKGLPKFIPSAFKAGILLLSDIWNFPQARLLTYVQVQQLYGRQSITYLQYYGLITAIPGAWLLELRGTCFVLESFLFPYETFQGKTSTCTYDYLCLDRHALDLLKQKWSLKLNISITQEEFLNCFERIYSLVLDTRMCNFQYRFLHRAIFCAVMLHRWKMVDSPLCFFCKEEEKEYETIEHLFFHCTHTQEFWRMFSSWFECLTDTEINLTAENVFLCNYPEDDFLNMLLLIAKQYIFSSRIAERLLNVYIFKDRLMNMAAIERQNALSTGNCKKFIQRWHRLFPASEM